MKRLRFPITKKQKQKTKQIEIRHKGSQNTRKAQLQLKLTNCMWLKHNNDSQMVVRKTSKAHKPTNEKDAFSRNNDTTKANCSFYTQAQHLTGAHYSRLQHSIDSCRQGLREKFFQGVRKSMPGSQN